MIRRTAAVLCTLLAGVVAPAQPVPHASIGPVAASSIVPPAPGQSFSAEKYEYSVQWQFFHAGMSTVSIQDGPSGLRVAAEATSAGFADKMFHVHDIFNADVDRRTFCTTNIVKHSEEGARRRELRISLDYPRGKSKVEQRDLKTSEVKSLEFDIPACVTDVVSGFFYVASLPLATGYSQTFPVNDNGRTTDVRVDVEGRDQVKVAAGEFQALRVKATPLQGPMKGKGVLWVWFSEDARHTPVQMKSKLGFATLVFQLQKITR